MSLRGMANHLVENRRNKEEGQSMQRGGQPVHTKPMTLTFGDFEYICTIPTSGNILLHFLLLHSHSGYSASSLHLQVQPYNLLISLVCCALSFLSIRVICANCLLLSLLCCALESRDLLLFQFITCFHASISCRLHILWVHLLCSHLALP